MKRFKHLILLLFFLIIGILSFVNKEEVFAANTYKYSGSSIKENGNPDRTYNYSSIGCGLDYATGVIKNCDGKKKWHYYAYSKNSSSENKFYIRVLKKNTSKKGVRERLITANYRIKTNINIELEVQGPPPDPTDPTPDPTDPTPDPTDTSSSSTSSVPPWTDIERTSAKPPVYTSKLFEDCNTGERKRIYNCWAKKALDYSSVAVGAGAVLMIMIGGYFYLVSGGEDSRVRLGKKLITNAIIGIAVIVLSHYFFTSILNVYVEPVANF